MKRRVRSRPSGAAFASVKSMTRTGPTEWSPGMYDGDPAGVLVALLGVDAPAGEDPGGVLDVVLGVGADADGVQLEQLAAEVLVGVLGGGVAVVEVDQHRRVGDGGEQDVLVAAEGVGAQRLAVRTAEEVRRLAVQRHVEVVLPELRHHLRAPGGWSRSAAAARSAGSPGTRRRRASCPSCPGPTCACGLCASEGHQPWSWSAKPSEIAPGFSCCSHHARAPPAARTWAASAGVTP